MRSHRVLPHHQRSLMRMGEIENEAQQVRWAVRLRAR
jgi:hypothetical protein